jgi:heme/copper-type cytochrome/quinol oxidase subunit 2
MSSGMGKRIRSVWPGFVWAMLGLLAMLIAMAPLPVAAAIPAERKIQVKAGDFSYTPGVITVNRGDHVTIELVSTDVAHGLYIDGYGLQVAAEPGQSASLSFIADHAGTFHLRCAVPCGDLHPFMIGKLKVKPDDFFWRAFGLAILAVFGALMFHRQTAKLPIRG